MKNKVKFSIYAQVITAAVIILCIIGEISLWDIPEKLVKFNLITGVAIIAGLYYCPISVEANQSEIKLYRLLGRPRIFTYRDIQSVDTCYPSAGGIRLCGSGGLFGYWGYFSDIMIGTYFGYYGSRSYCFLVKLKNGKQYVLGCENPVAMVEYIESNMEK